MILDLLDVYRKNAVGDSLVTENYQLREGLYFRLYGYHKNPDILHIEKRGSYSGELWEFIRTADFYSQLVDMNKSVDPKKQIHSNNIYSIAFKAALLTEGANAEENFKVSVIRYYQALYSAQTNDAKLVSNYQFTSPDDQIVTHNQEYVVSLIPYLKKQISKCKISSNVYIKLYFVADIAEYIQESKRYLIPKIFNRNEYNVDIAGKLYGLSNCNMGMNAKKPYLEHKTTAFRVPFRLTIDDALEAKNMLTWLDSQQDAEGKPLVERYLPIHTGNEFSSIKFNSQPRNVHYLHLERGKQPVIDEYDFLPGMISELVPPLELENFLMLDNSSPETVHRLVDLESIVDDWLFNKNLIRNYFSQAPRPNNWFSSSQVNLLIRYKEALRNYFRKGDKQGFVSCIDRLSRSMLKEMLLTESYKRVEHTKIALGLNLRLSLLKYCNIKEKNGMGDRLRSLAEGLKDKLSVCKTDENIVCENDQEFYYYAGQIVRYLVSVSQAQNRTYAIIDQVTDARDVDRFKQEIVKLHKKYSYLLSLESDRYNRILAAVMAYDGVTDEITGFDLFLAGVASKNMI
ncbi:hypothetical protein SRRS_09050 [Sporomusa rhizae]|uniref:hypothetical protein n=1 Tax=Sporomusa rhizae TaxID=357999 RepID=UPI00352A553B